MRRLQGKEDWGSSVEGKSEVLTSAVASHCCRDPLYIVPAVHTAAQRLMQYYTHPNELPARRILTLLRR